jgi:hypothetical protein
MWICAINLCSYTCMQLVKILIGYTLGCETFGLTYCTPLLSYLHVVCSCFGSLEKFGSSPVSNTVISDPFTEIICTSEDANITWILLGSCLSPRIEFSNPMFNDSDAFTITDSSFQSRFTFKRISLCFYGATLVCAADSTTNSSFLLGMLTTV